MCGLVKLQFSQFWLCSEITLRVLIDQIELSMSDTEQLTNIEEAAAEAKKEEKKAAPKVIPRFFNMSFL